MDFTRMPALLETLPALHQAAVDDDEGPPLFASYSRSFDSPIVQSQKLLLVALEHEVAAPLLEATTQDEYGERLASSCLDKYVETRTVFRVLQRQTRSLSLSHEEALRQMLIRAEKLMGPEGVDQFDFAASTYRRAMTLAKSLRRLDSTVSLDARKHDVELVYAFKIYADIFQCSRYVIFAAAERDQLPGAVGVECAFEILKGSARQAYTTARERADLRKAPEDDLSPLPFDEEDCRLAGITQP